MSLTLKSMSPPEYSPAPQSRRSSFLGLEPFLDKDISDSVTLSISNVYNEPGRIHHLIHMLLKDDSLAGAIRRLTVQTRTHCYFIHESSCDEVNGNNGGCTCVWLGLRTMFLDHMDKIGANECWKDEVGRGSETALAGLLFTLLPGLEHLDIQPFTRCKTEHATNFELESKHFSMKNFFGKSNSTFDLNCAAAFRGLKSISTPSLLPWSIMSIPTLMACSIGLEPDRMGRLDTKMPRCVDVPPQSVPSAITDMTVTVAVEFLQESSADSDIYGHLPNVLRHMPFLKRLRLQLSRDPGDGPCPDVPRKYDSLIRLIPSQSLEVLIIDTYDIDYSTIRLCTNDFYGNIQPITSLQGLPNLRRIVVPQEALIWVEGSLMERQQPIPVVLPSKLLPPPIESIEVIDSTTALNHWTEDIVRAKHEGGDKGLASLKQIVLWCDRWYPTLVPDYRVETYGQMLPWQYTVLGGEGKYGEYPGFLDDANLVEEGVHSVQMKPAAGLKLRLNCRSDKDVIHKIKGKGHDHAIWRKLEAAGVAVVRRPKEKGGWRK